MLILRCQRPQPPSIAGRHPGNVETKPDLRIGGEVLHRFVESVTVDQTDPAKLLDNGEKLTAGDDATLLVAHPQQAFEIIDLTRRRANHRLECKEQAVLA